MGLIIKGPPSQGAFSIFPMKVVYVIWTSFTASYVLGGENRKTDVSGYRITPINIRYIRHLSSPIWKGSPATPKVLGFVGCLWWSFISWGLAAGIDVTEGGWVPGGAWGVGWLVGWVVGVGVPPKTKVGWIPKNDGPWKRVTPS